VIAESRNEPSDAREPASAPGPWLSGEPTTHRLIVGWTLAYALGSWALETGYWQLGIGRSSAGATAIKCSVYAAVWAPLLFAAVALSDRLPVRGRRDVGRVAIHAAATLAATFAWSTLTYYLCLWLVPGWRPLGLGRMYITTGYGVTYVFSTVVLICHLVQQVRRQQAREVAALAAAEGAANAQMQVLLMELRPHFLGNTLHAASALLDVDRDRAVEVLRRLRALLAHAMRTEQRAEVPLAEELETLRWYADIQQLRFGDRLRFRWSVDAAAREAAVPALLLQPIVENAVKFSAEATSRPCSVTVEATRRRGQLILRVVDDGVGLDGGGRRGTGVGLSNARERLRQLYGADQDLTLTPGEQGQGTLVEVRLPYRRLPATEAPQAA
jgi:two-component system, LytTR family, sensor kinase